MKKRLAIGCEDFPSMQIEDYYYVDKTAFIRPLMMSGSSVHLITRPRRFGKSLFLDTLRTFLGLKPEAPNDISLQQRLFANLAISEEKAFCDHFMGKTPVIYLSLKGVDRRNFRNAYQVLARRLVAAAEPYALLAESPHLNDKDKEALSHFCSVRFMEDLDNREDAAEFIGKLAAILAKHYGRPAVLLVDEYDVPLAKAAINGYYEDMVDVIKALFDPLKSSTLKKVNDLPALQKAILTGCLRVSKESIFTGLNNLDVNTVCSNNKLLASAIGFTQSEVDALLDYYGLSSRREEVKRWYDGYRFADIDIYCPWDVINFCKSALESGNPLKEPPQNFWLGTSDNAIINDFIDHLTRTDTDHIEKLLNREAVEVALNEQVNYDDIARHRPADFWTLLLFSGYLTVVDRKESRSLLAIPNEEIRDSFKRRIEWLFSNGNESFVHCCVNIVQASFAGNINDMSTVISEVLENYVSVRDCATRAPAENYYHGFLLVLFASAGKILQNLKSNREAGDGYADLSFTSTRFPRVGVVIEIKYAKKEEVLEDAARKALDQIHGKHYVHALKGMGASKVFGYGIAFHNKSCIVLGEQIGITAKVPFSPGEDGAL